MVGYGALTEHLAGTRGPFGLLSQQCSPTADYLRVLFPARLNRLFSAEHGWFGAAGPGEKTADERHPAWGLKVCSLYGETRKPTPEMLAGLSRVVVDLGDIGVRCYTYFATLKLMLEACAENGVAVTVLDRPIPLGDVCDGPGLEAAYASFVAPANVPLVHGMTPGECAQWLVAAGKLDVDLTVVGMRGWTHERGGVPFADFMPPSPAIVSWDSARLYPLLVFTEAYPALDCNRGEALSFRVLGGNGLDAQALREETAGELERCGVVARVYRWLSKGTPREGLLFTTIPEVPYKPVTAGFALVRAIGKDFPAALAEGARPEWFDRLAGGSAVRENGFRFEQPAFEPVKLY